jgi:hypothetical protein
MPNAGVKVKSELEIYLEEPIEHTLELDGALGWWHAHRARFPTLSRMALDFLSAPGELSFWWLATCN